MTRAERLAVLGPAGVAAARRVADAAPPPSPEILAELRPVLAPALARIRAARAEEQQPLAA